jgi:septal ring factor EnvC (AmiA/AmiB activator)
METTMRVFRFVSILAVCALCAEAQADIYKCVDEQGGVTYTNDKPAPGRKGCSVLSREQPISTVPATPVRKSSATPTPSNFPRVEEGTQRARDSDRRKILDQELATEEKSLEEARKALAEQESIRQGDERNYARVLERLQPFKDKVALHERNIEAIKKEIAGLR